MEISDVKNVRKQLGLTQKELANQAGVSQSLIAKLESGRLEPSYSKAKKIMDVLESKKTSDEPKAEEVMSRKIYSCKKDDNVDSVIKMMKKKEISQVPVIKSNVLIGLVSESSLLDHVFDEDLSSLKVEDVMQNAPPTVSPDTPESAALSLLKHFPLVAVVEEGDIIGVITKADIVRHAYS